MLLTRRHPACRCNLAPSSPVDILVRPGGFRNTTNYMIVRSETELSPRAWNSLTHFVTDCTFWHLQKYLKIYLFTQSFYSTEQQPANFVKRPCISLPPITKLYCLVHSTFSQTTEICCTVSTRHATKLYITCTFNR